MKTRRITITIVHYGRYIVRAIFLFYLVWVLAQIINLFRQDPGKFIQSFPYDIIIYIAIFGIADTLIGYLEKILTESIRKFEGEIIGIISCYNTKLTLSELAIRTKLTEDELERILADINIQGEYYAQIDKETKLLSITPIRSLVGPGTPKEKLEKLEALFKEGKISRRTYETLKEEYSKEKLS